MSTSISVRWRPAPLKRFLSKNDSGVWGDDPTGIGDCLVLRSTDIALDGSWAIRDPAWRSLEDRESRQGLLREGDLVLVKSSGSAAHLGKTALVTEDVAKREARFANFVQRVRPASNAHPRYLWYLLNSSFARRQLELLGTTTTGLRNLNGELIGAIECPGPPLSDQRAIADFLDAETTRIDALVAKKRRMIELLDERDRRMIDECFAPRNGETLARLARFASVQTGITLHEGRALDGDIVTLPYLRVANVQPGWLDLSEIKTVTVPKPMASRSTLRGGDVLMTEGGDRDKLGRGTVWRGEIPDCLHQNHVFAVRPIRHSLDSGYLGYLTRTSYARAYFEMTGSQSTNLASTSASKVADFSIPALPAEEQRARVDRYQRVAARNKRISTALTEQLALLAEHRQALITAAVTGRLEIPGVAA